VKTYCILDLVRDLPGEDKEAMAAFIKRFQTKNGDIHDSLIRKRAMLRNILSATKNLDFNNFLGAQTIRAETRQAISALNLLGKKPSTPYLKIPRTIKEIEKYLNSLDWSKPWSAGSHFSHLTFFLKESDLENKEDLINLAIDCINKLQFSKTGGWYIGNPSLREKINGAMKVITGLKVLGRVEFRWPEKLIDLCLSAKNDRYACDNFNIVYVLHYACKLGQNNHRFPEIKDLAYDRLGIYKQFYWPEIGGFSFLPERANQIYYGAKITKGFREPDIHGTVMFAWGISIIAQILGFERELGFQEIIA